MIKKIVATFLTATMLAGSFVTSVSAQGQNEKTASLDFTINSPYATVNWDSYGQYKADFHSHSNESDGTPQPADTIEEHYKKGFDILALTDHNVLNTTWNRKDDPTGKNRTYLTDERLQEITYGTDRDGRGMVAIANSNEQSKADHLNTFFTPFNNEDGATLEGSIAKTQELGGICHINHPGRYYGGRDTSGTAGMDAANNPVNIQKYVQLLMKYDSCVGMEIINKLDGDSYSDRILWDNILKETMPQNRFVWGFSNDDTHRNEATGHSYNMMLMPTNNPAEVRKAMENGTFYASARVAKREGYTITDLSVINNYQPPVITNIKVDEDEDSITIDGDFYNTVEWIADGNVIATGNTIDLNDYEGKINSYIRAQLKGDEGISFTQPFGISKANIGSTKIETDKKFVIVESNDTVTCTVSMNKLTGLDSFDVSVSYDENIFEVLEVKSLLDNTLLSFDKSIVGTARMIIGTDSSISGDAEVMQVTLKLKEGATKGVTSLHINNINTANTNENGTFESPITVIDGEATVEVISYYMAADINKDDMITLADLSIALSKYQSDDVICDIDHSGKVDTADFIIIAGYIE